MAWFQWSPTLPGVTPGAMNMAFESQLLAIRPMIGPAIGASYQFRNFSPLYYQAASMTWLTGLTGVVHGQSALQPLSNPYGG